MHQTFAVSNHFFKKLKGSYLSILAVVCLLCCPKYSIAQITLTPNLTANALVNQLVGPGIIFTNATLTCPSNASGRFTNGLVSSILIDSGIVLTTGRLMSNATSYGINGNGNNFASRNNSTTGGDANLASAASTSPNNIYDLCKLEFDFVPTGDSVQFNYRFGSEEYPEYNCTEFNDIFAFFISGPGYPVPTNLALVPGTTIPVSINSINNATINSANGGDPLTCSSMGTGSPFTSLYVDNTSSTTITYDGLTSKLTAKAVVAPCSTYHMKFAIADLSDHIYDSGVFLEAGSFKSDVAAVISVSSSNSLSSGTPFAIEGCTPAVITIKRPTPKNFAQTVTYTLTGTATNGVDVSTLSGSATIPAFDTLTSITVNALQDGINEGTETLIFAINGSLCGTGSTETLTLNILEYPTYSIPNDDTLCLGLSVPLSIIPIPPNPNISFAWSPNATLSNSTGNTSTATPLANTTYTISSSYPGCPLVDSSFTIFIEPTPVLTLTSAAISCVGLSNGSIQATATVSSVPLNLTLLPSGISFNTSPATFNNLALGSYTVIASSGGGCTISAITNINAANPLNWAVATKIDPLCNGGNGSIQTLAAGGAGLMNYTLLPSGINSSTGNFTSLSVGAYTVVATDANGCSIITNLALVSAAPNWNTTASNNVTTCFGGNNGGIQVNALGGTGILNYTLNPSGASNTSGVFPNLTASNYIVIASDANGCSVSTVISITQPSLLQIINVSTTPINCYGYNTGAFAVTGTGGTGTLNYTLFPGNIISSSGNFSNLSAGAYTVIVNDANGCSSSAPLNLSQPSQMVFTAFVKNNVACNGGNTGSISVNASGGSGTLNYTLLPSGISNTSGSFPSLLAGSYTVQVVDAYGCSIDSSAIITQQASLVFSSVNITNVTCYGFNNGTANLVATGGTGSILYELMPGNILSSSGNYTSLATGNYIVTATDNFGCSNSTIINIAQPSQIYFNNVNITHPICSNVSNGVVSYNGIGGTPPYLYALNSGPYNPTNTFTSLGTGNYILHIKDSKGCIHDTVIALIPINTLYFATNIIQHVLCKYDASGAIWLQAIGGTSPYSYQLNGVSTGLVSNYTNLVAGIYSIYASDLLGCTIDTTISINEPAMALQFNTINLQDVLCFGDASGKINITASGGTAPYQFALNGLPYQFSGNFSGLVAGIYSISLKDNNGCKKDTVVNILSPLSPVTISLNELKEIPCIGLQTGEITVSCNGGTAPYSFSLNTINMGNDTSYNMLNSGNYAIEVKDKNGCKASITAVIPVPVKRPYIHIIELQENICKGDQIAKIDWSASNGFPPYSYYLNTNFIDTISEISNLSSGTYHIELIDSLGCKTDTTIEIESSTTLSLNVKTLEASCTGIGDDGKATASVVGGVAPYSFLWDAIADTITFKENLMYGSHTLIVQDAENCTDTLFYQILYQPCCDLYMPNAFSPNGDGQNDVFKIINYGVLDIKSFEIFDRWGKKIFISKSMEHGWDGTFQGVDYEIGTYYYLIKYYCRLNKELQMKKGDFTLLR